MGRLTRFPGPPLYFADKPVVRELCKRDAYALTVGFAVSLKTCRNYGVGNFRGGRRLTADYTQDAGFQRARARRLTCWFWCARFGRFLFFPKTVLSELVIDVRYPAEQRGSLISEFFYHAAKDSPTLFPRCFL